MTLKNLYNMSPEDCEWIHHSLEHYKWKEVFKEFFGLDKHQAVPIEVLEDFVISYRWHYNHYHEDQKQIA